MTPRETVDRLLTQQIDRWRQQALQLERYGAEAQAQTLRAAMLDLHATRAQVLAETEWLTLTDYARTRGVKPATVRRWCQRGEVRAMKDDNDNWLVAADALRRRVARPRLEQAA